MKKLLYLLLILFTFNLSAQPIKEVYPQPKYPQLFKTLGAPIMPNDPEWVRAMYSSTPNLYTIVKLYNKYYETHLLKKTTHTQNYKHFYRIVTQNHYYDEKGNIIIKDIYQDKSNQSVSNKSSINKSIASDEWTPVAPLETFDENGNRKSAHVNVYSIAQSASNPNILYMGTETGAVFKSVDKAENWTEVGKYDFNGGTAQAIKIDPNNENVVYVAYDTKFFKTTDGGNTWNKLFDSSWQIDVEVNPNNSNIVYVGGNFGLKRSTNGGQTWTTIIPVGNNEDGRITDIEFKSDDPSVVFVAKANAYKNRFEIWKSTDNGLTFSPKTSGWYEPSNPYRPLNMGIQGAQGAKIANTKADPNRLYVLLLGSDVSYAEDLNFIGIFRSDNAGESWTMPYDGNNDGQPDNNYGGPYNNQHWCMSSFGILGGGYDQGWYNADIDASDTNPDVFLVGMLNLFKSENGGKSYIRYGGYQCDQCGDDRYRHPDIQDILVQGSDAWIASDGGVDKYSSNLVFVDAKNKGVTTCDLWGFDQGWNEDILVGGRYHDGNMAYHENYGNGRTLSLGGGESHTGYVNLGENRKVYHDDIGGKLIPNTLPGMLKGVSDLTKYPTTGSSIYTSEIENDPRYWNHIYIGKENKLWESWNYGKDFTLLKTFGYNEEHKILGIEISRQNPNLMFVNHHLGSHVKLYRTNNGGQSWTEVPLPMYGNKYTLSLSDDDELFIAFDKGKNSSRKVYKSTNLGNSWQNITSNVLNGHTILDIEAQGGTNGGVYAISTNRVFYRNNNIDWQPYSEGIPNNFRLLNAKIFYKKSKLRLAGNRGVWERDLYEPSAPIAQPMVEKRETFCDREQIQFEDYSMLKHQGATWQWSFPGASYISSTTVRNPLVSYNTPGTYDVTLTVTTPNGSSTKTVQNMITVNESNCSPSDYAEKLAYIDGENQYLTKEFKNSKTVTNFTFTGWIKPNGIQPNYSSVFYIKGDNGAISLDFKNGKNELGTHSGGKWWYNSGLIVPQNRWSYVALIYTPSKVTIVLNEKTYQMYGNFPPIAMDYIDFGIHDKRDDRRFKGSLEEVCLWDKALSLNEIRLNRHLTKKNNTDSHLFAYYQFNSILEKTIYDMAGNNDLSVLGGVALLNSTCPVGPGVAQRKSIINNSTTTFDVPKVKIIRGNSTFNGDVVITRLNTTPFFKPTNNQDINNEYYFIENYGSNPTVGALSQIEFTDIQNISSLQNNEIILYQRERSSESQNGWLNKGNSANISDDKVSFSPINIDIQIPYEEGTSYQSSGQFYLKSTKSIQNVDNDGDGIYQNDDIDDNNACVPNDTPIPTITEHPASCKQKASATISNYDTSITYSINPNNATIAGANITGMDYDTEYTLTATKNNCAKSISINISDDNLGCNEDNDGDGIYQNDDIDDNNACVPNDTPIPTITEHPASCKQKASATISNYDTSITYSINPNNATISGANITEMDYDTEYTLTAIKNNCAKSISINISDDNLGCNEDNDGDGIIKRNDDDDNNACIPNDTPQPTIVTQANCNQKASATISNYDTSITYSINPNNANITGANITGMNYNTQYTLTATKNNCSKHININISDDYLSCDEDNDRDGVQKKDDVDDNNACVPNDTPIPTVTKHPASCKQKASATISNYDASFTYSINPNNAAITGANITGMNYNTQYTLTATKNNCSKSIAINISDDYLGCDEDNDRDGVQKKDDIDDNNACIPNDTPIPTVTKHPASCKQKASATISNYDTSITYSISPNNATISGANITEMDYNTEYTLTATKNNCSKSFVINISDNYLGCNDDNDGDGIIKKDDDDDNNACVPNDTPIPTIIEHPASCNKKASATISNYDATTIYTISPDNATINKASITGIDYDTEYTLTATKNNCSKSFVINISDNYLGCNDDNDGDGIIKKDDDDDNNACIPNNTPTPILITRAICNQKASAIISNYDATITYSISPDNVTINGASITGMEYNTRYTLTTKKNNCVKTIIIRVSDKYLDCEKDNDGDGILKKDDIDDNNACIPNDTPIPTIIKHPASCKQKASATISNYDASITYSINPNNATINGANITGMDYDTEYTLIATKNNCAKSISINISADNLGCNNDNDGDGIIKKDDDDDNNACIPNDTPIPIIIEHPASCKQKASATISNYDTSITYSINPNNATISGANITEMDYDTEYTLTATKNNCAKSISINISADNLGCNNDNDGDGIIKKDDDDDNNACIPNDTPIPIIIEHPASCKQKASATISNYDTSITYSINPNNATISGANITEMDYDTEYTLTATKNNCSKSVVINISDDNLGCNNDNDGDGIIKKDDDDDNNACIPNDTPIPIIIEHPASCKQKASATISNYDTSITYSINPNNATISGANITEMDYNTEYTLTATKNNCSKSVAISISNDYLGCDDDNDGDGIPKRDDDQDNNACFPNDTPRPIISKNPASQTEKASATISNYDATITYSIYPTDATISGTAITGMRYNRQYTLTASRNSCVKTVTIKIADDNVGIDKDITKNPEIILYPNPSKVGLGFAFKGITPNSIVKIYDVSGRLIIIKKISENEKIINISQQGIYSYFLETENRIKTGKIIVE